MPYNHYDPDELVIVADSFDEYLQMLMHQDYAFINEDIDVEGSIFPAWPEEKQIFHLPWWHHKTDVNEVEVIVCERQIFLLGDFIFWVKSPMNFLEFWFVELFNANI